MANLETHNHRHPSGSAEETHHHALLKDSASEPVKQTQKQRSGPERSTSQHSQENESKNSSQDQTGTAAHKQLLDKSERSIQDALKKNPNDLSSVYSELQQLRSKEDATSFKKDLARFNDDLHKSGLLPGLDIVDDQKATAGFSLQKQGNEQGTNGSEKASGAKDNSAALGPQTNDATKQLPAEKAQPSMPRETGAHHGGAHHGGAHHGGAHHGGAHHGGAHHEGGHHRGGHHGGGHHGGGHERGRHHSFAHGAYDNVKAPDEATLANSVKAVLAEAKAQGLSPEATKAAIASMLVESKGNPQARGDGNTSFGLFQLHRGGELSEGIRKGELKNENDAFDPAKNAHVALSYFKNLQGHISDPGRLAAAAQRPRDRQEYAAKVDELIASHEVDSLIQKYGAA